MTTRALAVLFACMALAACGGDENEGSDEFLSEANAICAEYGPKIEAIPPPLEDIDEWGAVGADMGDQLEASVNELRLVQPPDDLTDAYAEWIGLRADLLTSMRARPGGREQPRRSGRRGRAERDSRDPGPRRRARRRARPGRLLADRHHARAALAAAEARLALLEEGGDALREVLGPGGGDLELRLELELILEP